MKSKNDGELHLISCCRLFDPGILNLPLESVVTSKGSSVSSSKKILLLVDWSKTYSGGIPLSSIISESCSYSFSPGNIGYPVKSSTRIQPKLHMSIAGV